MPPRKRRRNEDDDDDEEEGSLEAENGVRSKRKAAVQARAKVVQDKDSDDEEEDSEEEEDDDDDEDFNEEDEEDEDEEEGEEGDESKDGAEGADVDDENEGDEDDEDVDADAVKIECVEAVLEEPTPDVPGYVLKKKEDSPQKLEMWFSEEMSETVGDITEALNDHYENKKLPVLQITKFDVIEETDGIYQIDVLEAKYDKAYAIREKEKDSDDSNLAHSLHCLVRVDGKDKTWCTQYFMPEED